MWIQTSDAHRLRHLLGSIVLNMGEDFEVEDKFKIGEKLWLAPYIASALSA